MYGVKVGDEVLKEYEDKPPNIWGGAELTDNEKKVLNLPKKHRVNTKIDDIGSVEVESNRAKIQS